MLINREYIGAKKALDSCIFIQRPSVFLFPQLAQNSRLIHQPELDFKILDFQRF